MSLESETFLYQKMRGVKSLTWNSRPLHCPHIALPYQLLYTSTCLHQQHIEPQNPRTQKVNRRDQDQPDTSITNKLLTVAFNGNEHNREHALSSLFMFTKNPEIRNN